MVTKMSAKTVDGKDVVVVLEDKGDVIPGYAADGSKYAAFTTMIEVRHPNGAVMRAYVQVDKELAERSGDILTFRQSEHLEMIGSMYVEPGSLVVLN